VPTELEVLAGKSVAMKLTAGPGMERMSAVSF
jgi:hypothetical protein